MQDDKCTFLVITMMRMIRLMVDFGPFFVDSATRTCGLKDHGVDFGTWELTLGLGQSGLEDLLWTQRLFLWTQRLFVWT